MCVLVYHVVMAENSYQNVAGSNTDGFFPINLLQKL